MIHSDCGKGNHLREANMINDTDATYNDMYQTNQLTCMCARRYSLSWHAYCQSWLMAAQKRQRLMPGAKLRWWRTSFLSRLLFSLILSLCNGLTKRCLQFSLQWSSHQTHLLFLSQLYVVCGHLVPKGVYFFSKHSFSNLHFFIKCLPKTPLSWFSSWPTVETWNHVTDNIAQHGLTVIRLWCSVAVTVLLANSYAFTSEKGRWRIYTFKSSWNQYLSGVRSFIDSY